ncbi:MAG: DUF3572 family protein [Sphingomonas sp.]
MADDPTNDEAIALHALGWTLADERRADRFLALTGLSPEALRQGLDQRATLAAAIRFLEAHEPDLIACAAAIGVKPADLPETRRRLEA